MKSGLWQLSFVVPAASYEAAFDHFDEIALSAASFEYDGNGRDDADHWQIDITFDAEPDLLSFEAALNGWHAVKINLAPVQDQDWLNVVAEAIKPIAVGPFFIHSAKDRDQAASAIHPIEIEAGLAFGSGEHPTTRACLNALLSLPKSAHSILDMGAGSAVLAIAAAKLWPNSKALGIEIDPRAAAVGQENTEKNGVAHQVQVIADDGYNAQAVKARGPFDLIFANILADAVKAMAGDAFAATRPGGHLIVSGLLTRQAIDVTAAHQVAGFRQIHQIDDDGWSAIVFEKPMV